ncbi:MAG: YlxR family protein, partial [Deltaproteobacteria bacterium]|nr:YlxR family protein [Deltaproteobacteria bacterium]
ARGPVRTCLGCLGKKTKVELVRLTLNEKGEVIWDYEQIRPGRGAYICPSRDCLAAALKAKKFSRAFRRSVSTERLEGSELP